MQIPLTSVGNGTVFPGNTPISTDATSAPWPCLFYNCQPHHISSTSSFANVSSVAVDVRIELLGGNVEPLAVSPGNGCRDRPKLLARIVKSENSTRPSRSKALPNTDAGDVPPPEKPPTAVAMKAVGVRSVLRNDAVDHTPHS
jgi:hypothetical protein